VRQSLKRQGIRFGRLVLQLELCDWDSVFDADGFGFVFQKHFSAFFFGLVDDFYGLVHGYSSIGLCVCGVREFKNGFVGFLLFLSLIVYV
jgi:hypothetical protein